MHPVVRCAKLSLVIPLALCLGLDAGRLAAQACGNKAIVCGQTIDGQIGSGSCSSIKGLLFDAYTFSGTNGEQVTATISATAPDVAVLAALGEGSVEQGAVGAKALAAAQNNSAQFTYTLDQTSGEWYFAVTSVDPSLVALGTAAPYTLSLACSGLTSCRTNASTMCLVGGRFKVQATFNASNQSAQQAQGVTLSDGSGYLWFFTPTSAEAMVKVVDGCALNGHYWVFAGGLTNVHVVLTVTDSKTGVSKQYTNPQNTTFEPIQDTSAFSSCP